MPYELVVDNFAGGGGASTGIRNALGRDVDIAINHDASAIAMHRVNHPTAKHYQEDVWDVDPIEACNGRPVGIAWFSPDCKHFSKAKGGQPVDKKIRGLAWVAVKWAKLVHPRIIILENVEEFQTWGPVIDGHPDPAKRGQTFKRFVSVLKEFGYQVEWKELRACDFGAPTVRKRFFLIARCDGKPIVWPAPTHGDPKSEEVKNGTLKPWIAAKDIIDWPIPCPSVYAKKEEIMRDLHIKTVRPLGEKTMRNILQGVEKFGEDPFLIQYHDSPQFRGQSVHTPLRTVDSSNRYGVCRAFLIKYYGTMQSVSVSEPMPTQTAKDRFGLVMFNGDTYTIRDIGLRMLTPRELFNAQGFPNNYVIDVDADGRTISRKDQVARCGNAVCPPMAEALVKANAPEMCLNRRRLN